MDDEQTGFYLQPWIDRARAVQRLVGLVDLERIANHDVAEFKKLAKVSRAMNSLCIENDNPVSGVDHTEEALTLDDHQMKRSELVRALDDAGYSDRLGRIYISNFDDPIRPLDLIPHIQGLPEFDVCMAPEHSPPDGAQGIFISERGVFAAFIPEPAIRHKWRILRSRPYDDLAELLTTVRRFAALPTE